MSWWWLLLHSKVDISFLLHFQSTFNQSLDCSTFLSGNGSDLLLCFNFLGQLNTSKNHPSKYIDNVQSLQIFCKMRINVLLWYDDKHGHCLATFMWWVLLPSNEIIFFNMKEFHLIKIFVQNRVTCISNMNNVNYSMTCTLQTICQFWTLGLFRNHFHKTMY